MTAVLIAGAGAFGTALAVALAKNGVAVTLWARDAAHLAAMERSRENARHLPGIVLPQGIRLSGSLVPCDGTVLLALPMQALGGFLAQHGAALPGQALVACCKGLDLASLDGPSALMAQHCPGATPAVLTGPGFAADIARGLPTALTLATPDRAVGQRLQAQLSTPTLRLYLSPDMIGAELGGALKNVIAIAAGVVIGAGLGDSARAALMTRGFAEMQRAARVLGADPATLFGLSGLGDLILTCTSDLSRNFGYGKALGAGRPFDPRVTVEGAATAHALTVLARERGIDMPITAMVSALIGGKILLQDAVEALLSRPLTQE